MYQLDATWYHLLSIPRAISHLEIKHDLPCPENVWNAESASAWAHRNLVNANAADRGKDPSNRFIQVVRGWMAPTPTAGPLNSSYSALLLVLYMHSGVREVSGWSTMTGRICFERFEVGTGKLGASTPLGLS